MGDFKKFTGDRQVASYLGLSPTSKQSGTSLNPHGPISRMGKCGMRSLLYLCGISAIKYNGDCEAMWTRMKTAGKPGKVIIVAMANKLVRQALAIVKNNSVYIKNYANCP